MNKVVKIDFFQPAQGELLVTLHYQGVGFTHSSLSGVATRKAKKYAQENGIHLTANYGPKDSASKDENGNYVTEYRYTTAPWRYEIPVFTRRK